MFINNKHILKNYMIYSNLILSLSQSVPASTGVIKMVNKRFGNAQERPPQG